MLDFRGYTRAVFLFLAVLVLLSLMQAAFASGHVAVTLGRNPIDSLLGGSADYEAEVNKVEVKADAQFQSGDILDGDGNVSLAYALGVFQVVPFAQVSVVYTSDLGHALDGGLKLNFPWRSADVAVGFFGRSSQAFVPLQTGTRNPVTGEVTWEDATLLNFDDLGILNLLIEAGLEWRRVDLKVTGIFDASNRRFHQVIGEASSAWAVTERLDFIAAIEYIIEDSSSQSDMQFGFGYKF